MTAIELLGELQRLITLNADWEDAIVGSSDRDIELFLWRDDEIVNRKLIRLD